MSLSSLGKIDLYAETGLDQWEILKKRVEEEVQAKTIKAGDRKMMRVDFGVPLTIEIRAIEMPQEKLL